MLGRPRFDPIGVGLGLFLGAVLIYMAAPIVFVIINSFNSAAYSPWPPPGFSLQWYGEVAKYSPFVSGFRNSVVTGLLATLLALALGTLAAYAFTRYRFRGRSLLQVVFFSPLVVPRVAIGLATFILFLSVVPELYASLPGLALVHTLLVLPFVITIVAANLSGIDPVLEEAAQDLGATPPQTFRRVILPQLRVGFVVAGLFAFITSFDEVETTIFLVRSSSNTLPVEMFLYIQQYQTPTIAALSTILIAITLGLVLLALPMLRGQNVARIARRREGE